MNTSSTTILIIDDERPLLDLFSLSLRHLPYTIQTALSAQEASAIISTHRPDLITLDLAMPGISGVEFLKRLRADPATAAIKVIILTAVPVLVDAASAGLASLVLAKPIRARDLERAVVKLMET